jgi:hypothetical protein
MRKILIAAITFLLVALPLALLAAPPDPGATLWMVEMPRISMTMPPATPWDAAPAPVSPLPTPAPVFSPLPTPTPASTPDPLCLWVIEGEKFLWVCGWRGPDWQGD